ncbi:hypothetical protein [Petrimonas sulfuriphila]|uniref:hypothetical protein n=1 Tax=Petrimonas sulfuriphila TaxID=285070 RepID=UPI003EBE3BE8
MTKQEFISASLPYKLKMKSPYGFRPNWKESTGIVRVVNLTGDLYADIENRTFTDDFIPIVRPLSNLTKEIVQADYNDGKPFIPIVELAKMSWDKQDSPEFLFQSLKDNTVFIAFVDKQNVFGYDSNSNSFFGAKSGESVSVVNQLQLFQQLLKFHFDLITEDCKKVYVTDEFNPYK